MSENGERPAEAEDGFEYAGTFYRWHVSDMGKDLMLIDRFSGLPVNEFFALVEDEHAIGRTPVMLALIATSMRHRHPDWSVERVARTVEQLNMSEIEFLVPDEEPEEPEQDPPEPPPEPPPETPADEASSSPPSDSSPPSTPQAGSTSETSFGIPV